MSNNKPNSKTHLIAGFTGGLLSAITLQPLDLLKTRIQQQSDSTILKNSNLIHNIYNIKNVKNLSNIFELWKGTLPSALRTSIGSALYLTCLNYFRSSLAKKNFNQIQNQNQNFSSSNLPKLSMKENLLTGALTRAFVGFLTMPFTVIKTRYESTLYNYNSLNHAIKSIYNENNLPTKVNGIKNFFLGFNATTVRDAPYAGIYVLIYEKFKLILNNYKNNNSLSINSSLINSSSAIIAASLATTITAPFDTIKTRMQLNPKTYNSFLKTFKLILTNEKFKILFQGLSLRLTRKALSAGIAWCIYEEIVTKLTI
ncbi:Hem25p [Ascoidea rubescens DSM 1968]|uniref:Mitochondrial glycine transporter n=1 Tax=Ascoidea rubescens DSM 1968 TaxID=1344418 RepID=A0A1D2VDR1_9ASCO|nr:mitochondrial carrier [Ascoidea rubescens DSM 1968]ODV59739.1 mitochondrial carrier [Ascoidea rubescens DSM 1968]